MYSGGSKGCIYGVLKGYSRNSHRVLNCAKGYSQVLKGSLGEQGVTKRGTQLLCTAFYKCSQGHAFNGYSEEYSRATQRGSKAVRGYSSGMGCTLGYSEVPTYLGVRRGTQVTHVVLVSNCTWVCMYLAISM